MVKYQHTRVEITHIDGTPMQEYGVRKHNGNADSWIESMTDRSFRIKITPDDPFPWHKRGQSMEICVEQWLAKIQMLQTPPMYPPFDFSARIYLDGRRVATDTHAVYLNPASRDYARYQGDQTAWISGGFRQMGEQIVRTEWFFKEHGIEAMFSNMTLGTSEKEPTLEDAIQHLSIEERFDPLPSKQGTIVVELWRGSFGHGHVAQTAQEIMAADAGDLFGLGGGPTHFIESRDLSGPDAPTKWHGAEWLEWGGLFATYTFRYASAEKLKKLPVGFPGTEARPTTRKGLNQTIRELRPLDMSTRAAQATRKRGRSSIQQPPVEEESTYIPSDDNIIATGPQMAPPVRGHAASLPAGQSSTARAKGKSRAAPPQAALEAPFAAVSPSVARSAGQRDCAPAYKNDPFGRLWCICGGRSEPLMIFCDGKDCPYQWYHYRCLGLRPSDVNTDESVKWFCPQCEQARKEKRAAKRVKI